MDYYDIHTHHSYCNHDTVAIYNSPLFERIPQYAEFPNLYFSAGIHPWHISEARSNMKAELQWLEEELKTNKYIRAVGECGLDKLVLTNVDLDKQIEIFQKQILLSEKYEKPIIIHCVKAYQELIQIYKKNRPNQPWIMHGFRGNPILAQQLCSFGFYLSFGFLYNEDTPRAVPANKILLETDEANCNIDIVYKKIALSLNMSLNDLKGNIRQNVSNLSFF